jgi:hypothetical protein
MAAATLPETPTTRKPLKAYRATLRDEPGTLAKVDGEMLLFTDTGAIVSIEPEDCVWLCILGEIGLADTQALLDRMHGNAAWIATHRAQEVA